MDEIIVTDAEATAPEKVQKRFTAADCVLAILSLFSGYALHKLVFSHRPGLGLLIICVAAAAVMLTYFSKKGFKFTNPGLFFPVSSVIFAFAPFLTGSVLLGVLSTLYAFLAIPCGALLLCSNSAERFVGDNSFFDALKAVFVMPFSRLFTMFAAIGGNKTNGARKKVAFIFLGIILAIVPTVIIVSLLMSADTAFDTLMQKISEAFVQEAFRNILIFCFCLPISMYFFGMLYANSEKLHPETLNAEKCERARKQTAFCPSTIVYAMLTPILLVYVIYFAAQFSYFTSAFSDLLPEGFTYAEYARQGFFELCAVACINALLLICANVFTKRDGSKPLTLKIYSIITSLFTLVLIATAIAKMFMYIGAYGLTQLRVYTTWFMILVALFFIFMIVRQFSHRFNIALAGIVAFVVMFALLEFGGIDARIAQYNVYRYTSGKSEGIDFVIMPELGGGAVEYVLPLVNDDDPEVRLQARGYILEAKRIYCKSENSWVSFNIDSAKAKSLLEKVDIEFNDLVSSSEKDGALESDIVIP